MRKEFEEHQKKSILPGAAANPNPLQNFDMAAWMAGRSAKSSGQDQGDGAKARRRG